VDSVELGNASIRFALRFLAPALIVACYVISLIMFVGFFVLRYMGFDVSVLGLLVVPLGVFAARRMQAAVRKVRADQEAAAARS
jgi:hypothetical protein